MLRDRVLRMDILGKFRRGLSFLAFRFGQLKVTSPRDGSVGGDLRRLP